MSFSILPQSKTRLITGFVCTFIALVSAFPNLTLSGVADFWPQLYIKVSALSLVAALMIAIDVS